MLNYEISIEPTKNEIDCIDLDSGEVGIITCVPNKWDVPIGSIIVRSGNGFAIIGTDVFGDRFPPQFKCQRLNEGQSINIKLGV